MDHPASGDRAMIEVLEVSKRFGKKPAVNHLTLRINRGEFFAFLGPNGAGKTTTIKMMTGLLRPTAGHLRVAGFDIQGQPREAKSRIGYVPDQPFLYENLTAVEHLRFVARLFRVPTEVTEERIELWLKTFRLEDQAGDPIGSFSHGMRQKVVFASALLHRPDVYVIDEPMVGLDPASARLVKDILREECRRGATVFLSTHTLSVAEELADRIGIIHQGRLLACGGMADLQRESKTAKSGLEDVFLALTADGPAEPDEAGGDRNVIRIEGGPRRIGTGD